MKKMKLRKLVSLLAAVVMVVAMIPAVGNSATAQAAEGDTTSSGIELSKTATLEDDGTYTIDLEAYATGTTTTTTKESSVPLDIVLVIDQSGSMTDSLGSTTTYIGLESTGYSYQGYGSNTYYYLAEDGNYYKASRGDGNWLGSVFGNHEYYLSYTSNGTTYYLSGTGTTTTRPTDVSGDQTTIWTGVLYTATTTTTTKLAALESAVTSFVKTIQEDAEKNNVDHRIAIAGFASNSSDGSSGYGSYSITRLRTTTTTASAADGISTTSLDELVTYANSFSLLSTVAYTNDVVDEEELDTNIDTDAENDDAYEDMNEGDIVIDNPAEDTEGESVETEGNDQQSVFSKLFNTIRNWFNGRR